MNFMTAAKGAALSIAIQQISGSPPVVVDHADYVELKLSPGQQVKIRDWIEKQMSAAPGDVRIDIQPIVMAILVKKLIPFVLGAGAIGYVIGRL